MDHTLTWLLLVAAVVLIGIGATRFDLLAARWRELLGKPPAPEEADSLAQPAPKSQGMKPHEAPPHKPAFHRSGRRH